MTNRIIRYLSIFLFFVLPHNAIGQEILTWDDCLKEAARNNPNLISAQADIDQKKAGLSITASSLFPQINAELSAQTTSSSTLSESTGTKTKATADSYGYGVSASQLIFDGLKTVNDVSAASENINASRQNFRFVSTDIRLSLRSAFITLLKNQELIPVAEQIADIRRGSLELITLRYYSGLEHKGALLLAEANLAQANFELSQAKRNTEFAQWQLTKEMGRKEFIPVMVNGDFRVIEDTRVKPDFTAIAEKYPSVMEATARKNSAAFAIRSAYGNFIPKLSGSAGASRDGAHWPPRNKELALGLSVSMPLFEGGLKFAQLSQAQALYNQSEANAQSAKDSTIVSLARQWTAFQDAVETVEVKKISLAASEERSKIAEAQYSNGFITFDNWIIIENELVNAKKSFLQAKADALIAEANWIQAKGETLEYAR